MKNPKNVFSKIIPEFFSKEKLEKLLGNRPQLDKQVNGNKRILELNEIKYNWFTPLSRHLYLANKVINVLQESCGRWDQKSTVIKLLQLKEWFDNPSQKPSNVAIPVLGFTMIGLPGMGKTMSLERILSVIPQVVIHEKLGITQVAHLKIDCTYKGSTKQICRSFFNELDRLTGENYSTIFSNASEEKLVIQMANKAILHRLGVLIIDEVHNLRTSSKEARERVLDFFKELTNKIGVPIIYIGTPEAVSILSGNFQLASRAIGIGSVLWDRMTPETKDWNTVMKETWKLQVLKKPGKLTVELSEAYFKYSGGIFRVLVNLHCLVQELAIYHNKESITLDLLEKAKSQFFLANQALEGLAVNNPYVLQKYKDLNLTQVDLIVKEIEPKNQRIEKLTKSLWSRLSAHFKKIDATKLMQLIQGMVNLKGKMLSEDELYSELEMILINWKKNQKPKLPKGKSKGDLISATENGASNMDNYHLLKQAGFISSPKEVHAL